MNNILPEERHGQTTIAVAADEVEEEAEDL